MSSSSFNNGIGGNGTSFFEQVAYWTIKSYFYNQYDVLLHYKINNMEYDIAIPSLNTLIECQSELHVNSTKMDKAKQDYCREHNIRLIQIMNWNDTSKVKINYQNNYIECGCTSVHIRDSIEKVLLPDNKLDFNKIKIQKNEHSRYITATYALLMLITNQQVDTEHFCNLPWAKIWQTSINNSIDATLSFENSLASRPDLVKEFRGLIRYPEIQPRSISLGSKEAANWECGTCGHKWQTIIYSRTALNSKCIICDAEDKATCKNISKSFYYKYKSLVPFIKANNIQEKEDAAKKLYASSNVKTIALICPHCQKERIIHPFKLQGVTNIRCKHCKRLFIE